MPMRYDSSDEDPWINAVLIRASQPRRADSIEQARRRQAEQPTHTSGANQTR